MLTMPIILCLTLKNIGNFIFYKYNYHNPKIPVWFRDTIQNNKKGKTNFLSLLKQYSSKHKQLQLLCFMARSIKPLPV